MLWVRQDLNLAGAGTQTAALAFGGRYPPTTGATEEYDGTTWTTSPGSLNTARYLLGGAGTQTAALAFGGQPGTGYTTATEEYDGSTWTKSYWFKYSKRIFRRNRNSNSSFSFWGLLQDLQERLKNMTDLLGLQVLEL
jgi:hypothetical protein